MLVFAGVNTGACISGDADCDGDPGSAGSRLTGVSSSARDEVVMDLSEYMIIVVDFGVDNTQATIPANDFWLNPNHVRLAWRPHLLPSPRPRTHLPTSPTLGDWRWVCVCLCHCVRAVLCGSAARVCGACCCVLLQVAIGVYPSGFPNTDNLGDARVVRLAGDPRTTPGITVPQTSVIVHNYNDADRSNFPGPNLANPHFEFRVTGYGGIATYLNVQNQLNGYTGPGAFFDVGACACP
jgi:hypothetical protein